MVEMIQSHQRLEKKDRNACTLRDEPTARETGSEKQTHRKFKPTEPGPDLGPGAEFIITFLDRGPHQTAY